MGLAVTALVLLLGAPVRDDATRIATVSHTPGLIAFWDFIRSDRGQWTSYRDPKAAPRGYPVWLRRIGDPRAYKPAEWPYHDAESQLERRAAGPFGKAVRFNQGHVFAEVPRAAFAGTPLDLHGSRPFTLLAWTRFVGKRHLVAGVWDEGGWDRYRGRRQFALFGGLFGAPGVVAHVSATGAASFPQSALDGAQYARIKAIDGAAIPDDRWVCMGMSFDPRRGELSAYLDGVRTANSYADAVQQEVTGVQGAEVINPAPFAWPLFGPRGFLFKFNGYHRREGGIGEHALHLDLDTNRLLYARIADPGATGRFQIRLDVRRAGRSRLVKPIVWDVVDRGEKKVRGLSAARAGDVVAATLWSADGAGWKPIGTEVTRTIEAGAPFTFGRALGLGAEERAHGSQLELAGVAVFNRVLTGAELRALSFSPVVGDDIAP